MEEGMATHSNILAWRILWTRGVSWATVHTVRTSWTQLKQLSIHTYRHTHTHTHTHTHISYWLCFSGELRLGQLSLLNSTCMRSVPTQRSTCSTLASQELNQMKPSLNIYFYNSIWCLSHYESPQGLKWHSLFSLQVSLKNTQGEEECSLAKPWY